MRRALPAASLLALVACAPAPSWQVVSVRADADLPATETSPARVRIDDHSFAGTTGCADISGVYDGDTDVTLSQVQVGDPGDCAGWARHTHDQLTEFIVDGAALHVTRPADYELVLVDADGRTVRLMR